MGADAARRAFSAAEADGALQIVLSVGWAGALNDEIRPGDARMVSVIIDGQTHKRFLLDGERRNLTLVTAARVADAAEKVHLRLEYPGAMIVDMEAAAVAQLAQDRDLAMGCVKGISDGVGAEMPDLNQFMNSMGQLRMVPFLAYLAIRPKYWKSVIELGRNSSKSASSMRDLILEFLKEKNVERIRTGSK
jgi:adenosylhomocysteine nucleosidase